MRWNLLLAVLMVLSISAFATACPMCKESISNATGAPPMSPGGPGMPGGGLPGGFNSSVYAMLIGLFLVGGFVVGVIVRGVRGTNVTASGFPVIQATSHQA